MIHRRAVHEERVGRKRAVAWAEIRSGSRKGLDARRAERARVQAADQLEMRLVEKAAVPGASDALAVVQVVGEADARLDVVVVGRIFVDQRVVRLGERNPLEVVAQAEADGEIL